MNQVKQLKDLTPGERSAEFKNGFAYAIDLATEIAQKADVERERILKTLLWIHNNPGAHKNGISHEVQSLLDKMDELPR